MKEIISIDMLRVQSVPAILSCNFGELHTWLDEKLNTQLTVVTDETVSSEKKLVAELRKLAKEIGDKAKEVEALVSGDILAFRDNMKALKQKVTDVADDKAAQVKAIEDAKKAEIAVLLSDALENEWVALGVEKDFRKAVYDDLIKLGAVTANGALTKATQASITAKCTADLQMQTRTRTRIMDMENRCLRVDINPPLTRASIEHFLYEPDATFEQRMSALIHDELRRKEEAEERMRKKLEAEKQREIEGALKAQQGEADRAAKAVAEAERRAEQAAKDAQPQPAAPAPTAQEPQVEDRPETTGDKIARIKGQIQHLYEVDARFPARENRDRIAELSAQLKEWEARREETITFQVKVTLVETFTFESRKSTSPEKIRQHFTNKLSAEGKQVLSVSVEAGVAA